MVEVVRGVSALEEQLEKTRESLKGVDDTIKKLTGRDPTQNRQSDFRPAQRRLSAGGGGPVRGGRSLFAAARRGLEDGAEGPPAKRRMGGVMGRLGPRVDVGRFSDARFRPHGRKGRQDSGDEDDLPNKPTLSSSVIVTPKDVKSRSESIEELKKDKKSTTRNRRMFGLLLGTLQRFKEDSKDTEDKVQQRKSIEHKLEQKELEDKAEARKERQELFSERRTQQRKLRQLQKEMELVEMHKDWERQTNDLKYFIRTKAKPHLFYLPKKHNSATKTKLKETATLVEEMIKKKKKRLEKEIAELTGKEEEEEEKDEFNESQTEKELNKDVVNYQETEVTLGESHTQVGEGEGEGHTEAQLGVGDMSDDMHSGDIEMEGGISVGQGEGREASKVSADDEECKEISKSDSLDVVQDEGKEATEVKLDDVEMKVNHESAEEYIVESEVIQDHVKSEVSSAGDIEISGPSVSEIKPPKDQPISGPSVSEIKPPKDQPIGVTMDEAMDATIDSTSKTHDESID